jgi:hypothetical protein
MVVFVLKTLTAVHLKHLDHERIEAIWLRVVTKSSSVTIGSFYRPPDNTAFFEDIVIPLEKAWYNTRTWFWWGILTSISAKQHTDMS